MNEGKKELKNKTDKQNKINKYRTNAGKGRRRFMTNCPYYIYYALKT